MTNSNRRLGCNTYVEAKVVLSSFIINSPCSSSSQHPRPDLYCFFFSFNFFSSISPDSGVSFSCFLLLYNKLNKYHHRHYTLPQYSMTDHNNRGSLLPSNSKHESIWTSSTFSRSLPVQCWWQCCHCTISIWNDSGT